MAEVADVQKEKTVKPKLSESLLAHWDYEKNSIGPNEVVNGSSKKIYWLCDLGHPVVKSPHRFRQAIFRCAICEDRELLSGFNDLLTRFPDVAAEWDYETNNLKPEEILHSSTSYAHWRCEQGHSWKIQVFYRTRAMYMTGCKKCVLSKLKQGVNDLATVRPDIAAGWHPNKNDELTPDQVSAISQKQVWWHNDECGHEWQASIVSRTEGNGACSVCSNHTIVAGVNDLRTLNPELAAEWHPTKNGELTPDQVGPGSSTKIWWQCVARHEWATAPAYRKKTGCRKCAYIKNGINYSKPAEDQSFAERYPNLAKDWHPTKNGDKTPFDYRYGAAYAAWWLCENGHEWQAKICDRGFYQSGCRKCNRSLGEKELAEFLQNLNFILEQNNKTLLSRNEIDFYLPEKKIAVEYNGVYWHSEKLRSNPNYHYDKWSQTKEQGVQLIQIWEDDWKQNKDLIKTMLLHKLGLSKQTKIGARSTTIVSLNKNEAEKFMFKNHIQGYASGSKYLALKTREEEIIAVLILRKEKGGINIIRYATSANVMGGFTRLLKHAEGLYPGMDFITFSDHCVSDGGLYERNGFTADKELAPDYSYLVDKMRKHKFGYRLNRFKNDPALIWEEGKTERELAELNKLTRIWDAGKTRWVKHIA